VIVPSGGNLKFRIDDAADDGIFGDSDAILYEIVLMGGGGELIVVEGNGKFGTSREETFRVPQLNDEYIALVRASKVESKQVAQITGPTTTVNIDIEFSDYHEDLSWAVTSIDGSDTFFFEDFNHYRFGDEKRESIKLKAGNYKFIIRDRHGTDEFRAFDSYKLSYLDSIQQEVVLYESGYILNGDVFDAEFTIPESATSEPGSTLAGIYDETLDLEVGSIEATKIQEGAECTLKVNNSYCTNPDQCCSARCSGFRCTAKNNEALIEDKYSARVTVRQNAGSASRGRGVN